ncbi:hypothetical protein JOB18_020998 [Solea senegalensis]|uniref:Uncharacterized protein n=1 Tax=Solea senegalensis TaxID=28829 RepID=A0AAV6SAJ7_SOLSE|nr:uncharacterized protein LOC122780870 isoform X2 [Solea senegalensis]KAG7513943.1 hypothetical protein JOB18_020998 [Solea senegalensis]
MRSFCPDFVMGKEKKTAKLERLEPNTRAIIMGEVNKSIPRMRLVKSKEKMKVKTSNKRLPTTDKGIITTCETSGNVMKLCLNLMPVLASAKEPEEEDEEDREEDTSSTSAEEPNTSNTHDPSATKSVHQSLSTSDYFAGLTLDTATETKQPLNSLFVLPPITQPTSAPMCGGDHHKTQKFTTSLPRISLPEKTTTVSENIKTEVSRVDDTVTEHMTDAAGPWIDNILLSKCTVTQKLGRKRRSGEGAWGQVQSDHLLITEPHLTETRPGRQLNQTNIGRSTPSSVGGGHSGNKHKRLPALFPATKPTLMLSMTKSEHGHRHCCVGCM